MIVKLATQRCRVLTLLTIRQLYLFWASKADDFYVNL
jgi:hypothetical protein